MAGIRPPGPRGGECLQRWLDGQAKGGGDRGQPTPRGKLQKPHREARQRHGNHRAAAGDGAEGEQKEILRHSVGSYQITLKQLALQIKYVELLVSF